MTGYFIDAFIYLCAAVIAVPLAKRFGLGSVLGYLVAGVVIGPIVGSENTNSLQHFAEFGVVMMLFLVGLELEPKKLWEMRNRLMGLGGLQIGLTTAIITAGGLFFDLGWTVALTIGLIFALSSTAIVLQTFNEKNLTKTEGGNNAFSVLLFQDIAVIPMLALLPLLALPELVAQAQHATAQAAEHHEELSLVAGLPGWAYAGVLLLAIGFVGVGGHYLSRPLFRYVASSGLREIFVATSLMLVIGIAALMSLVGLSPALGAFLAGVVLANSEFRHELESNIEPFKGLLLGLFFITVGAGIDFVILGENLLVVIALTLAVMFIKALVLYVLALIFKIKNSDRWLFTLSLAQAGEFGFVLLSFTVQNNILPGDIAKILLLVVALSMFLTPALFIFFDKVILPKFEQTENQREADEITHQGSVIIAGVGRFGQMVNRFLRANKIETVVLDSQVSQVDNLKKINVQSYYGDATQPDLLHTAGISKAAMLVIAIDNKEAAIELTKYVKHTYPKVKIFARAFDRGHHFELKHAGADFIVSETYHSALELGKEALISMGVHPYKAEQKKATLRRLELSYKDSLFDLWRNNTEDSKYSIHFRELFIELENAIAKAMKSENVDEQAKVERGWTPPPKNYLDDFKD
ncbi:potassium transporter [Shewanella sp. Scap07]|uniref:monovalent cation:proton antiporter-2 (CPA2) family protein n=1 Tax=Shewanella sp. Scap07 TaxID=2589987 RepID=UPI0015BC0527|nr:monovalent cation:proton antiporter-2 (CPA2) family protein [Shewanella sp. Scap07]QLE86263.1 potassium transporter [Shewanella sp. Scap07]